MSSSFIYNIRKYSGDAFAHRWKSLSERLANFEARNAQVEQPDFLNEQLTDDSRLRYHEIRHINTKPAGTIFQLPFEPDLNTLTCWLTCDAWGNVMKDASLMGNDANFVPSNEIPIGFDGPDKGYGGGSVAMELDGETQSIKVYDRSNLQLLGTTVGISIGALVNVASFDTTPGGQNRYIVSKSDDANNYYGVWLEVASGAATGAGGFTSHFTSGFTNVTLSGGFSSHFTSGFANITGIGGGIGSGVLHFWVWDAGTNRSVRTIVGVMELDTWHWIVCTFNQSSNIALIYVDGLPAPTVTDQITDGSILTNHPDIQTDMHVFGNRGDGFFQGRVSDFRFYREKVLTGAEVANLNSNMITTTNIPIGNVAKVGFSLINPA